MVFTVFLDLDGPVFEGKLRHYMCYCDIIKKYGGVPLDIDDYWHMKRNMVKRDVILEKSKFQGRYQDFFNEWMNLIESPEYLDYDFLKLEVLETLDKWKKKGFQIVLVTMRQNRERLLIQLKKFGVYEYLDNVIDCPPLRKNTKYEAICDYLFDQAVFIGDTEEDTKTAKMLGVRSVGIKNGLRSEEFLDADFLVDEICNIDFDNMELF